MYHPSKIAHRIRTEVEDVYHFTPVRRSVDEVAAYDQYLRDQGRYIFNDEGQPTGCQSLDDFDRRWQLNERCMVMVDADYGVTRYGFVIDEEAVIKRFAFRVAQQILFGIIADLELDEVAIEIMILKARQLGMTTIVELLIMLRIVFSYGVNAVIASADQGKSLMMAKKLLMAYDMLPVWLRPQYTARVESERGKLEFGTLNSGVSIQHGNQMSGIARGATPTVYHLSECASFSNAADQIEAALFKAVHPSPSIFGILESTGEGDVGWWADTWRTSKAKWAARTARLLPLFLPWFVGLDIYPKPAWMRAHPVPPDFYANRLPDTQEHVAKAELYVRTHDLIRRHLCCDHPNLPAGKRSWWADGTMPIEQQWFWEVGHEEAKAKSLEGTWFQEMASDDVEALQRSSESVFGYEVMTRVDRERKRDYAVYGISGQSIEDDYEPDPADIDYDVPRVPVVFRNPRGPVYNWELIPLRYDAARVESYKKSNPDAFWDLGQGRLFVWHPPRPNVDYSIGIDTAEGKGEDSTVICVTEIAPQPGMPDIQAAEFRSSHVSHVQAYAFVISIAAYYASAMRDNLTYKQPLIAPEVVASVGDIVLVQLRQMGYSRLFRFSRYDNAKSTKSNKLGWYTFGWSRSILINSFIDTIERGWYQLNSPWTLHECEHFESHSTASGKIKQEHEDGEHDDGIFAAAISIEIVRGKQSKTDRSKKRFMGDADAQRLPAIDLAPYGGQTFPTRSLDGHAPIRLEDL